MIIAFILGLGLATGAVVIVANKLSAPPPPPVMAAIPQETIEMSAVVLADAPLGYGETLSRDGLREVEWPAEHAPSEGFASIDEVFAEGAPTALTVISKGEPLLRSKLSGFGGDHSLAATLPSGKRAFTIRINDVSGVAGFVTPGDQVDVLLTRRVGGSGDGHSSDDEDGDLVAKVILQNIVVIGIDQATESAGSDRPRVGRTATVEVTPQEAQTLALAMQVGALSLVLRRLGSDEVVDLENISANELFGLPQEAPAAVVAPSAPPPAPTMRIRRGAEVSDIATPR
ncbi:MAG: Flp pilus assembly protein CpaB [Pseudomonadota bacterium]